MNKFIKTNKKIEKAVVSGYQAIEDGVVGSYQKIEDGVVGSYKKIENKFVEAFLTPDDDAQDKTDSGVNNQNDEKVV
ncbi:MAG: hypothetical protein LKJ75_08430 [Clostridia bacterium]|jgi:hypothetical protein|nr:hypothetical protein [Clostridia bacterium]MCI2015216.1 hypothetical protein [Clostridia bacterium]